MSKFLKRNIPLDFSNLSSSRSYWKEFKRKPETFHPVSWHSQRMTEKPALPWFIATQNGNIKSVNCICMAGLVEKCSYAAALMFYIQNLWMKKGEILVTSVVLSWGEPIKAVLVRSR